MLRTLENYFEGFIIKANHYRPNSSLYITALSVKLAIYSDFDKFCKRKYSQCLSSPAGLSVNQIVTASNPGLSPKLFLPK